MATLTVGDVLQLPVLASARPRVVSGEGDLDRAVRWMHSSEIFDIAPLLHGGEVLITSGLGLVGSSVAQLIAYVEGIAEAGVSALFFEIGRTFPTLPSPMLQAARRRGLVVVVLHGVTPFVDVTEAVHRRLVLEEVADLGQREALSSRFLRVLVDGGGPEETLAELYAVTGLPCALISQAGRLVAQTPGVVADGDWSRRVRVDVLGEEWGSLELSRSRRRRTRPQCLLQRSRSRCRWLEPMPGS